MQPNLLYSETGLRKRNALSVEADSLSLKNNESFYFRGLFIPDPPLVWYWCSLTFCEAKAVLLFRSSSPSRLSVVSARISRFCCVANLGGGIFYLLFLLFMLVVIDSFELPWCFRRFFLDWFIGKSSTRVNLTIIHIRDNSLFSVSFKFEVNFSFSLWNMFLKIFDIKLLLLLQWRFGGQPTIEMHMFKEALAIVEKAWLLNTIASYHFVN